MQFSLLMRFMEAPLPDPNPSFNARRGRDVFASVGCALCHTPQMQTAPAMNSAVLENRPVNLFSDLLVHHMGGGLADDIIQGAADLGLDLEEHIAFCIEAMKGIAVELGLDGSAAQASTTSSS